MKQTRLRPIFCVLLTALLVFGTLGVSFVAFAEQTESGYQYIADNLTKSAQITGYTGSSHMPSIPAEIDGYKVTSLKAEAFKGKVTLVSVTIPENVKTIGSECFSGCTLLSSVTFGKDVASIGSKAFENCALLPTVSLPAATSSIGAQAFSGCKALSSFSVNESNAAFKSDKGVLFNRQGSTLIAYPPAKSDSTYAVPAGVTTIESYAFCGAKNLTSVTIPASTTSIGKGAFKDCAALTSMQLPVNLTKLEDELFSGCKKLSSLNFPNTIKTIGERAFAGCAAIAVLTIPDNVTTVGIGAFENCTGISSVTIGKGVTAVSGSAFSGCTAIREYKVAEGASYTVQDGVLFNKEGTRLIAYPAASDTADYTVGEKVTTIGANAFNGCRNLKKLHIPATVKTFDDPVVKNCGDMVIYVEAGSPAKTHFESHTSGFASLKIGADKPGDVNADGTVDNADAILLRRYVAKWKDVTIHTEAADVNKDTQIDNADVILLRRFVAGWKNVTLK